MWMPILLVAGALLTVAAAWIPMLEQWGPLFLLWTAGGAHLAFIVAREKREAARRDRQRRAA
jgi:hypothetical protein